MRHHHFLNFKEKSRAFLVDIRDRTSSAVNLTERKIPTLPHFSPLFSYRGFASFYSKDVLKVWWLYSNGVHIYRVNNTIQYWRRIKNWNPPDQTKIHTEISPQLYYMEKNPPQYIWHRFYVEEDEMTRLIPSVKPRTTDTQWRHKSEDIWKIWPMWQTKYTLAIPKNLGVGVNFRPCSEGYFLSGRP